MQRRDQRCERALSCCRVYDLFWLDLDRKSEQVACAVMYGARESMKCVSQVSGYGE